MGNKLKFKLNKKGVRELLKSSEMQSVCEDYANRITSICGDGYEATTKTKTTRVIVGIKPVTYKAKRDNYKNNTLEKAKESVRKW